MERLHSQSERARFSTARRAMRHLAEGSVATARTAEAARRPRGNVRLTASALTFLLSATLAPRAATASPLFELAGGISQMSGLNARVTGAGAPSAYFNPALLPKSSQEFELGVVIISDQISMTLDGRPPGGRVPLVVGNRQINDGSGAPISNATVPTDWLENGCSVAQCGEPTFAARPRQAAGSSGQTHPYVSVGLVSELIEDYLIVGLYGLVPAKDFTTANSFYNDEREQFFSNSLHPELYSDRLTATSLAFGAGSQIIDQLSIGLTFTLSLANTAVASSYVRDSVDYNQLFLVNDVRVQTAVAPHFGLLYEPIDRLDLAATVHSEQKFLIDTTVGGTLPSGNESSGQFRAVHSFVPWTFGLGASFTAYEAPSSDITLVGTATYGRWSQYIDRHGQRPGEEGDEYAWKDVIDGSIGVRYNRDLLRLMLDLTYHPTPVPLQTGRRNYVDNDRIGTAIGADYEFEVFDVRLRPGIELNAHRLLERYQQKRDSELVDELPDDSVSAVTGEPIPGRSGLQTNNPGWPGFASDGWILGGAVTLALVY